MVIRVHKDMQSLEALLPAWEDLLTACPGASIFSTWEWLSRWWIAFARLQELQVISVSEEGGQLQALAPLCLASETTGPGIRLKVFRLIGDGSGDSDNLGCLVRPGFEDEFVREMLGYLGAQASSWDLVRLYTLDPAAPAASQMLASLAQRNWPVLIGRRPWSVVTLPVTWESYLRSLSSKERGKVGTRTRRLEKQYQVSIRKCATESDVPTCLATLFRLHGMHWRARGHTGSFESPERRAFYQGIATAFLTRGWLEFWFLDLDGKPVATIFGFRFRDTVYSLQEGYDPAYSSDSVGYVLRAHVIRQLILEGVRRYDFLAGRDASKERWGAHVGAYLDLQFARPRSKGAVYLGVVRRAHDTKEWLRRHVPVGAWQFLKRLRGFTGRTGVLPEDQTAKVAR